MARVRELETIRSFLTGQGLTSLLDLVFTFVFFAVMFIYSAKLTLIVVASIPVYVAIAVLIRPPLRERINEKFDAGARSQQFLVESIVGAQTLKAASVEPMMQAQWEERLAAYVSASFDAGVLGSLGQNLIQYVSKATTALILLLGAEAVIEGSDDDRRADRLQHDRRPGGAADPAAVAAVAGLPAGAGLGRPARRHPQRRARADVPRNLLTLPPPAGAIELRGVSLRYRLDAPDALRNVSLSIAAGEVIGVVGASGSGKSTLTKAIQRLYSPHAGQVMLDGVDIAQLDPGWLRRQIGVVLQENMLFNRSIHENIALADPAAPRALVMQAARLAGADEFIAQLPQGYDTMIEERGANLSGGQRQRIAIARALVTNPRILILDEATSALDYESERIIQRNMRAIVRGRTVIIIAHRLAAVRDCDRIVGMRGGEIVEIGTHEQLLARPDGLYARLWRCNPSPSGGSDERVRRPPCAARAVAARRQPQPGVPACGAGDPRDAAFAAAGRDHADDLRRLRRGLRLVVLRPARRQRRRARQARADRAGQGHPGARSRQDRRDPGRQRPAGEGWRSAARVRPAEAAADEREAREALQAGLAKSPAVGSAIDAARAAQRRRR